MGPQTISAPYHGFGDSMAGADAPQLLDEMLASGYQALAKGAWEDGRDVFQRAVKFRDEPEAFEGLAAAAWWLDDAPAVFRSHERAYQLYKSRGDRLGAARMATWIGLDHYLYRGSVVVASGWLQRARRLLDEAGPSAERGWLDLWEAHIGLFERNDVALARRTGIETANLAASLNLIDMATFSLALEGLARVSAGEVDEGMRRLDEAASIALSGEMSDIDAIVTTLCYLIYACERVRDYPRAVQWCDQVEAVSRRWSYRSMFGVCRCHHSSVLMWRGDWPAAERELTMATSELMSTRPGWVQESVVRLAALRMRQGKSDEAATLFEQMPSHPQSLLGLAELALDRGDAVAATDLVDRFLRRVPPEDRTARVSGIEVAVRAWVATGATDQARDSVTELKATAQAVGTPPLKASASFASGTVLAATGDVDAARCAFEDAIDLYLQCGATFETAQARMELARALLASGRHQAAEIEARLATDTFRELGAICELRRAAPLLVGLGVEPQSPGRVQVQPADLTRREIDVLRLLAQGLTNHEVAGNLFISVRTVERHVSTIYVKVGAKGSAARAIATVYAIEHGLADAIKPK
ncbi:hypothetical protein BH24CHL3_BH24CHL3_07380 [soil metagenome]